MATTKTHGMTEAPDRAARGLTGSAARCHFYRELAGVGVCWAASSVVIVTDEDCDRCPVPAVLERVDCCYLWARVDPVGRSVRWFCCATDLPVNAGDASDCSACEVCARARSRVPAVE